MHKYEIAILKAIGSDSITLEELVRKSGLGKDEAMWALEGLSKNGLVRINRKTVENIELSEEGARYAMESMPEEVLLNKISKKPLAIKNLESDEDRIGIIWAKKQSLAIIQNGMLVITEKGKETLRNRSVQYRVLVSLKDNPKSYPEQKAENKEAVDMLKDRKLIVINTKNVIEGIEVTKKGFEETKGLKNDSEIDALNKNIITNGLWKGKKFKAYDVDVPVEREYVPIRHPLRQMMDELRRAYVGMGFVEIDGPIIEPAFRVFDTLFMPQDHPARDMQDTFYLKEPHSIKIDDHEYVERIKEAHVMAWKQDWSRELAEQALLRTHMTNVSGRYVHNIIEDILKHRKSHDLPIKLFSIGRVFRNENIDYKHLADFYQTDGVIIGKKLTLSNLFSTLTDIYASMNVEVKFKPSYFPFVEPGAEVYAYSKNVNEWIEVGGAGVMRSQVTGVERKDISVLAWGLGVERMLMMKDKTLNSISEMYNCGIRWSRERRL